MDRLLVVGSTGLVGSKVASKAGEYNFEAYCTHDRRRPLFPMSVRLDITDRHATFDLIREVGPTAIINTAALTNVDYCESHRVDAERVNVGGVSNLVEAAKVTDARLVHISTDSVFDGTSGPYDESDKPHPINEYSKTKLESEKVVSRLSSFAIARPSVVYGWHQLSSRLPDDSTKPMNFAVFVLEKLKKNESIRAVTDQRSSPTFADNLAYALLKLARCDDNGIFHTAGRSCLSRYEFAILLSRIFDYSTELVRPIESSELAQIAPRPKNCCLRVQKAENTLQMQFLTAEEGVREMKRQAA